MTRLKRSRPSPALIVGVLALVAALAGTAVAADPVAQTSISKKKTKRIATNKANKAVEAFAEATFPIGGGDLGEITERSQTNQIANGTTTSQTVNCESEERVISGGSRWDNFATTPIAVFTQEDKREGNGWRAGGINVSGATQPFTVYAYCLEP
jgi:hypothetical protein